MFINDIFKKKLNEGGFDIPEIPRAPQPKPIKDKTVDEAGPFSYGAKKARKGSVADLAAKKRKEQERDKQPMEPRDQMVGTAKVVKGVAEDSDNITAVFSGYGNYMKGRAANVFKHYGITVLDKQYDEDEDIVEYTVSGSKEALDKARAYLERSEQFGGMIRKQGVAEGSVQDRLYKRHQELRKKSGLPDPEYYKELKASYDLPDAERYAKQKEIKQKYKVTNEDRERYIEELQRAGYEIVTEKRMTCPECGGVAYEDKILAEKQDACYHKVKSRYKVWPSAYASGALVRCRKKGAKNWGNKSK